MKENQEFPYEDIINLSPPNSRTHPRMSNLNRAAQFSAFAALTGYDRAIKETSRLTDSKIELDETVKMILDEKLQFILSQKGNHLEVNVTYFQPDETKSGGAYVTVFGVVKKIDHYEHCFVMQDEIRIPIAEIVEITGDDFVAFE